ncbi:MAG: PD-(D/E)XK nuclease family protein [Acidobacteriota bacterium]
MPVKRLAPSRFTAFVACPLREVFRTSSAPRLLASVGAAHLGTVIHELLERAAKVEKLSATEAETLFGDLLRKEEETMLLSATARTAVPLATSVRDFEVRKRRAIHAAGLSAGRRQARTETGAGGLRAGTEVWVQSADGTIGGYVDEVAIRDGAVVIRDFKSGAASRRTSEHFAGALQQVQMYAALYADMTGTWPSVVEIVPVDGEPIAAAVDRDECESMLRQAKELLAQCNDTLALAPASDAALQLARPAPETCRRCEYRPLCAAYDAARQADDQWPRDVTGTIMRRENLRNGTVLFTVGGRSGVASVRGVKDDNTRHEALPLLVVGSIAGFYNLTGGRNGSSYTESALTSVVAFAVSDKG